MTCMIDRWHDAYHGDDPDYVNCPYCQDELLAEKIISSEIVPEDYLDKQEGPE